MKQKIKKIFFQIHMIIKFGLREEKVATSGSVPAMLPVSSWSAP
jgi:hypothetical protein